jgi:hypothetical protein
MSTSYTQLWSDIVKQNEEDIVILNHSAYENNIENPYSISLRDWVGIQSCLGRFLAAQTRTRNCKEITAAVRSGTIYTAYDKSRRVDSGKYTAVKTRLGKVFLMDEFTLTNLTSRSLIDQPSSSL